MKKPIPVGYEDFKRVIDRHAYYVDKTAMLKTLMDSAVSVSLLTRPRRFGKTLNLSMIRRFFEKEMDDQGQQVDNGYLFDGLAITSCGQEYLTHQQQYPVINLSLKSAKQPNFEMAYGMLKRELQEEFGRHRYALRGDALTEQEKVQYEDILALKDDPLLYAGALRFLSDCLAKYHGKNAIILIDEYDVPLENAWFSGFYEEMIGYIRSLFESALKTNPYLEFAVITGCLHISRESIFTGLNNLKIYSILSPGYSDSFGFTEREVKEILAYYDLADKYEEVRQWYDGYQFSSQEIYNPWSIINYVDTALLDRDAFPKPYWSNTSSNSIIRELVEEADFETRSEIESLIAGNTIEKPVHEDITYGEIHESRDNLWNFLYFTGYLKAVGERKQEETSYLELTIPNAEIRSIYRSTILTWFDKKMQTADLSPLLTAIETGDCETFGRIVSEQLLDTISFFDYAETYYHGFLSGLLKVLKKYQILSNRESGIGRPDILMKTPGIRGGAAVILELKVAGAFQGMEDACMDALSQIEERDYEAALRAEGYRDIKKYGVCFYRKDCLVMDGADKRL